MRSKKIKDDRPFASITHDEFVRRVEDVIQWLYGYSAASDAITIWNHANSLENSLHLWLNGIKDRSNHGTDRNQ